MELKENLQKTHEIATQKLFRKVESKEYYDKDTEPAKYEVSQKVLLYDETVRRGRSRKLSLRYIGLTQQWKRGITINKYMSAC
jgi:hypothetical protein